MGFTCYGSLIFSNGEKDWEREYFRIMNMPSQQKALSLRTCKNTIWFVMTWKGWKGCSKRGPSDIPNWTWFLASQIKTSITEYLILQGLGRCGCPTYDGWSVISFRQVMRDQTWFFACLRFDIACPVWENDKGWFHTVHYMVYAYLFHLGIGSICHIMYICRYIHDCAWSPGMKWTPHRCMSQNAGDPKTLWKWWIQVRSYRFRDPYFETYQSYFWRTTSSDYIETLYPSTSSHAGTHPMMTNEILRDPQEKESHPWSHHSKLKY